MSEKLANIILDNEDISSLDDILDERQKVVFSYFVDCAKKIDSTKISISLLVKYFLIDLNRGSLISRYLNGENINVFCLNNNVEMIIYRIIQNNYIELDNSYSNNITNNLEKVEQKRKK